MKNSKLILPSDILYTCLIIVVCIGTLLYLNNNASVGNVAVIRQNGQEIARLSLHEDRQYTLNGDYENIFEISNGHIKVLSTNCPNQQCTHYGSIHKTGSSIICAPNKVSITIEGEEDEIDAFTG